MTPTPELQSVRDYWEQNPVAARSVPFPLGAPEYFQYYDRLREQNEPTSFSNALHEYDRFRGKRVLDIGCGNGYVLSRYAAVGARVLGIDLTRTAVDLSRRRFAWMQLPGDFVLGNAERLPLADETLDCVCSMGVLHHTPDTAAAVREVFRVLRPGGRVILMFYHRNSFHYRIKFPLVRLLTGVTIEELVNRVDGIGNPKGDVYSTAELRNLLRGFRDLELFAGVLPWHAAGALGRVVPSPVRSALERRWGWFLYARGIRP